MGKVTIKSTLIPVDQLKIEWVDAIRNACVTTAVRKAHDLFGASQRITVRDLNATDMSYDYNIFTETSNATYRQWNAMAFGAFTVATGTVIGIYGIGLSAVFDATIKILPISGIRIDVGGARVAQWHVQTLCQNANAAVSAQYSPIYAVTKSPIIIGEDITVTMYEYTRVASKVYEPCWLGVTVEKEGITLKP